MASELIFLTHGDTRGESILEAFAERTGLTPQPVPGGTRFPLTGHEHEVKVVETLTDIDANWERHITLGEPGRY